ncbi:MAG: hypothetical protein ACE37K_15775 [Planctomycetota bacterium]
MNFETFQEDFDLQHRGVGHNNFGSVTSEVTAKYPQAKFRIEKFPPGKGRDKLDYLLHRLSCGFLTVASLVVADREEQGRRQIGCHMMPLMGRDTDKLLFVESFDVRGVLHPRNLSEDDVVRLHNDYPLIGDDVVHLPDQ